MPEAALSEELIRAALAKADVRVCVGNPRCPRFPDRLEHASQSCMPRGRCKVRGTRRVIVRQCGRESGTVWREVRTGLVTLIAQAH